jgi:Holliday junction resolvase-like predicted endonuclease
VFVEVRSSSTTSFGSPEESIDARKVGRLYRAAQALMRSGMLPDGRRLPAVGWRIDLVTMRRDGDGAKWHVGRHLRGLIPP